MQIWSTVGRCRDDQAPVRPRRCAPAVAKVGARRHRGQGGARRTSSGLRSHGRAPRVGSVRTIRALQWGGAYGWLASPGPTSTNADPRPGAIIVDRTGRRAHRWAVPRWSGPPPSGGGRTRPAWDPPGSMGPDPEHPGNRGGQVGDLDHLQSPAKGTGAGDPRGTMPCRTRGRAASARRRSARRPGGSPQPGPPRRSRRRRPRPVGR